MPRCTFCGDRFYRGGFRSEPEHCDCGASMSEIDARDLSPETYQLLVRHAKTRNTTERPTEETTDDKVD
jgi:hypothetical protein